MKLRRHLNAGLLLLCVLACTNAFSDPTKFEQLGDRAYSRQQYDSAVVYYQDALHTDNSSAVNWFKLGNAQYRMQHFGEAVLAYERCLERRPGFAAAAKNVAFIQRQIQGGEQYQPIAIMQLWFVVLSPGMSDFFAWMALFFVSAPLLLLAFARYRKLRFAWLRPQIVVGSIVLGAALLVLSIVSAFRNKPDQIAIVMRQDAIFQETLPGSPKSGVLNLPEGLVVKVSGKKEQGVIVVLPDGRKGTIQRSDIEIVE